MPQRPPSTAGSCRSNSCRRRGIPRSKTSIHPEEVFQGRVDAEEDPQEDFLALDALLEDEGGQSTDYQVRHGDDHDLVGGAIGVVDPAVQNDLAGKALPGRLAHVLGHSRRTATPRRGRKAL